MLNPLEEQSLLQSGEFIGACKHVGSEDQQTLRIELISDEAIKTSAIEGEVLNRDSVQSSLRHQFGLGPEKPGLQPAERGISTMMVDLYQNFAAPLTAKTMFDWHKMLLSGDREIRVVGGYRRHADAMQVVSGPVHKRAVHFEAPPFGRVPGEMQRFITWFNDTAPGGNNPLPALTRASVAHLYFACIHPFEDGNGRSGLSAENYISITQASRATATRDLQDLVEKGALTKTGELRHTRYHLNLAYDRR